MKYPFFLTPFKFKFFKKYFKNNNFKLLDVGCANFSLEKTKLYLPNCDYYGLDITKHNYSEDQLSKMRGFFELDLETGDYSVIPDRAFDAVVMSHLIEHLSNAEKVIEKISGKLKPEGFIYIEFPSHKSITFPHKKGVLNFFDDPTHIRIYRLDEVCNYLMKNNIKIIKCGVRRNYFKIILMPVYIVVSYIKYGHVIGSVLWDLFGFAEYVIAKVKN